MTTLNFNTAHLAKDKSCSEANFHCCEGAAHCLWCKLTSLPIGNSICYGAWTYWTMTLDTLDILLTIEQSIVLSFHYECKVWLQPIPSGQTSELPEVPNCQRSAETAPRLWREWNKFPRKKLVFLFWKLSNAHPVRVTFPEAIKTRGGGTWCENGQRILKLKWTRFCQSDAQKYAVD